MCFLICRLCIILVVQLMFFNFIYLNTLFKIKYIESLQFLQNVLRSIWFCFLLLILATFLLFLALLLSFSYCFANFILCFAIFIFLFQL